MESECFADHYLINNENNDFSLSILFKKRMAFFLATFVKHVEICVKDCLRRIF